MSCCADLHTRANSNHHLSCCSQEDSIYHIVNGWMSKSCTTWPIEKEKDLVQVALLPLLFRKINNFSKDKCLMFWIFLFCSGPPCDSFVQPLYVCLYHMTQFFPQQGRLRGPAKPRMPTTAPRFFVFMKKLQLRGGVEGWTSENVVHLGSYG